MGVFDQAEKERKASGSVFDQAESERPKAKLPEPTFMQKVGKVISPRTGKILPPQFLNPPSDPEENRAWRKTGMDWFEDAFRLPMRTVAKLGGQDITDPESFILRPKYEKKKAAYEAAQPAFEAEYGKLPVDLNTSDVFSVLPYLKKSNPNATLADAMDFQRKMPQEPSKFMHESASDPTMYPIFKALGAGRQLVTGAKDLLVGGLAGMTGVKGAALRKASTDAGRKVLEDAAATGGGAGSRLSEHVNTMNLEMPEAPIVDNALGEFGFAEKAPIISELEKHKYQVIPGTELEGFQQAHNDKIDAMVSKFTGGVEQAPVAPVAPKVVKPVKVKPDPDNFLDPNTGLIDQAKVNARYHLEEKAYARRLKKEMKRLGPEDYAISSAGTWLRRKFGTKDGRGIRINGSYDDKKSWGLLDHNGQDNLTPEQMKSKMQGLYVSIDPRAPKLESETQRFNEEMGWGQTDADVVDYTGTGKKTAHDLEGIDPTYGADTDDMLGAFHNHPRGREARVRAMNARKEEVAQANLMAKGDRHPDDWVREQAVNQYRDDLASRAAKKAELARIEKAQADEAARFEEQYGTIPEPQPGRLLDPMMSAKGLREQGIRWTEGVDYTQPNASKFEQARKSGRAEIRKQLLEMGKDNPEFADAMAKMSEKLDIEDELLRLIGKTEGTSQETRAARLMNTLFSNERTNVPMQELFARMDKVYGTNFSEQARNLNYANQFDPITGKPGLLPVHTTGKATIGGILGTLFGGIFHQPEIGKYAGAAVGAMGSPLVATRAMQYGGAASDALGVLERGASRVAEKAAPIDILLRMIQEGRRPENEDTSGREALMRRMQ